MRVVVAVAALALQLDTAATRRLAVPGTPPCVPTEHMPVAGFGVQLLGRMPVLFADSSLHSRMPVLRLRACYLVDSLARRR